MGVLPLALLITVRLYDSFGLPPADLRSAMLTAETALRSGSIRAAWVVCPAPGAMPADNSTGCTGVPQQSDLLMRIVRAPEAVVSADALGFAAVDTAIGRGTLATVFADRISTAAARAGIDKATLVGYAMAHEIGHLLIGTAAHTPRGLMRAAWTLPEMSRRLPRDWRFSRENATQMLTATARPTASTQEPPQTARGGRAESPSAPDDSNDAPASKRSSGRTPSAARRSPLSTAGALRPR